MSEFPVNGRNLSFSDEDEEAAQLFITQNSFSNVTTQKVNDAIDFIGGLDGGILDQSEVRNEGTTPLLSQNAEAMCEKVFDFVGEQKDNGWVVENDAAPFIVTRKSDGEKFIVGVSNDAKLFEERSAIAPLSHELENYLKRFSSVVSAMELDASKGKRSVCVFLQLW